MTLVTLEQTQEAMNELVVPGKTPNGKVAFWSACLSTRNTLERNCMQSSIMRTYADRPLPVNRSELNSQLGGVLGRTLNSLYEIEKLWNAGIIHFNCGHTFEEQATWRLSMAAAIPGMGMKTVSFALHIYAPFECLLLTIDCWHCRLLGLDPDKLKTKQYIQAEAELYQCITDLSHYEGQGYAPIVYAACLWERTRQAYGNHQCKEGQYQSHAGLSCYC